MLIGIDASRAAREQRTGTEGYSLHLIRALLRLDGTHRYRLYFDRTPPPGLFPEGTSEPRVIPLPRLWTHVRLALEVARHPPDVLFVPAHVLPVMGTRRSVVTVHDLGYLYFPEAHRWLDRLYLAMSTRWNTWRATCVLTDSEATRRDLIMRYRVPAGRIRVAYPGWDENLWRPAAPAQVAEVKARYGIGGDYLLYLGTLQPRKNLVRLVEAFSRVLGASSHSHHELYLVLAGRQGWLYQDLFDTVRRLGLEPAVVFTGYVADEEAVPLMTGARAFVYPSLYEGFGFPLLEAMACDVPVVCSTTSSLPEVAGDAALLVDPNDVEGLAQALQRILVDDALRGALVARGRRQITRFSWDRCARQVKAVLEAVGRAEPIPLSSAESP